MSAKSDEKSNYQYEKSVKQNKINISEKGGHHNHQQHKEMKEEKYYEEKHYAEAKTDRYNRHSNDGTSLSSINKSLAREVSNDSIEEIEEADREFENLMKRPNEGELLVLLLVVFVVVVFPWLTLFQ